MTPLIVFAEFSLTFQGEQGRSWKAPNAKIVNELVLLGFDHYVTYKSPGRKKSSLSQSNEVVLGALLRILSS